MQALIVQAGLDALNAHNPKVSYEPGADGVSRSQDRCNATPMSAKPRVTSIQIIAQSPSETARMNETANPTGHGVAISQAFCSEACAGLSRYRCDSLMRASRCTFATMPGKR